MNKKGEVGSGIHIPHMCKISNSSAFDDDNENERQVLSNLNLYSNGR